VVFLNSFRFPVVLLPESSPWPSAIGSCHPREGRNPLKKMLEGRWHRGDQGSRTARCTRQAKDVGLLFSSRKPKKAAWFLHLPSLPCYPGAPSPLYPRPHCPCACSYGYTQESQETCYKWCSSIHLDSMLSYYLSPAPGHQQSGLVH
jgi:hypothetical protein